MGETHFDVFVIGVGPTGENVADRGRNPAPSPMACRPLFPNNQRNLAVAIGVLGSVEKFPV